MPKRHSPELRAAAVAAVATGEQTAAVAKRFGISQGLLHGWCQQDLPPVELSEVSRSDLARARSREQMAALIYDTIFDTLSTVRDQLREAAREEWVARQNADQLASLLDREIDGAIRLLSGFRPAEQPDSSDDDAVDASFRAAEDGSGVRSG